MATPTPTSPSPSPSFEHAIVPHLAAATRLARWILRDPDDADDAVQEASLRALRYFASFDGANERAWFLRIVRNTCFTRRGQRVRADVDQFDEEQHSAQRPTRDPEALALHTDDARLLAKALKGLPARWRDLIVLREINGLSYRELADTMHVPMGTVTSGLSRARQALRDALDGLAKMGRHVEGGCDSRRAA
jgi:RNA polymerase sigma-70 factor (ECF subfamily)